MEVLWLEQSLADVSGDDLWLSESERLRCNSLRVPKRRADWRLGRWTAKHAVASYLEIPHSFAALATIEIRSHPSGAPEVYSNDRPARVCVSISHSAGVAACAVCRAGIAVGCDLEHVEPRDPAFTADYFTTDEQELISRVGESERDFLTTLLWSTKESALKTLGTGLRLDTRCVAGKIGKGASSIADAWAPLCVCCPDDQVLLGWWRCSAKLVRSIVTDPSSAPPIVLYMSS